MKELINRVSDWWGERTAEAEDRTAAAVVPPAEQAFERLSMFCATAQQRVKAAPWLRDRFGQR